MKKIKITETQLQNLQKKLEEDSMQMDELGKEEYSFDSGKFKRGESEGPSPYEMADIVIKQIKLHPSFYSDREKMYEFLDAITTKLVDEVESGGLEKRDYDKEMTTVDMPQLNEAQKEMQMVFKKLALNEQVAQDSKQMEQLNKTYPVPEPQPATDKKTTNVESPDLLADRENFKSFFPSKNIEGFRVPLYKYIYSNQNNPELCKKLLKLLYKP
jgi:hypothetical protein